ncbi:hypothetical protein BDV93DRAFT_603659 [Ceratobasidium sp. AG-I]|nr:hypothetical protein BDV93DRAFT_603659 [Ceratobasidium sp. AG-I]
MPRIRKKTSKRGTTHQRTKIRQKVAETHKKRKRDAKKVTEWKSKHKKDPGIPNSLPFKEDILTEIEMGRRQAEEDKQRRKEAKSQSAPVPAAASSTTPITADDDTPPVLIDSSLPSLNTVLDTAHAVLYVLDARDPQTFRSKYLEQHLAQNSKPLILVLTKTDLVPKEVLAGWLAFLRNEVTGPVVAFRASDGFVPALTLGADKGKQKASLDSVSRDVLLDVVAEATKSRAGDDETCIAVIGLTNSGKSTLLNSIISSPALPTYTPGIQQPKKATYASTTGGAQAISLTHAGRTLQFIDTPGLGYVQFNATRTKGKLSVDEVEMSKAKDLLVRNRGSFVHWKETDAAAAYVVSRAKHEDLILHYNVPTFTPGDIAAFLGGVARASGRIRRGGAPDLSDTARSIARDWNQGRLPFFAVPPSSSNHSITTDPALEACLSLKEMRAAPRAWPIQLDAGAPDERDVALDAAFVVEKAEKPVREELMEVDREDEEDELESGEDEDEEMESGSEEDEEEDDEEESEEEDIPTPVLKRKSKTDLPTRPAKKVSFATKHQPPSEPKLKSSTAAKPKPATKLKPKAAPVPQRIGNVRAGGKKKAEVVSVVGEETYDFAKFF